MSIWSSKTVRYIAVATFGAALMSGGCTKEIDTVVVPLAATVDDLNKTLAQTDVEILPETKMHFKGRGLIIEKNF